MSDATTLTGSTPLLLHMPPDVRMSDEQFFEFCRINREMRIERTAGGDLSIMPPTGGRSGQRNAKLTAQLVTWAEADGSGVVFDSSTGFRLPNGADRSPDAAWVPKERLARLTDEEKELFLPLAPDFVAELRSPSDSLRALQAKMREYADTGTRLGWLIDPLDRTVYTYRPGEAVEVVTDAETVSGEPVLPSFVLDLRRLWRDDF